VKTYIAINAEALGKPDKTGVEWYGWQLLKYLSREWQASDPPVVLFVSDRLKTGLDSIFWSAACKNWRVKILPGQFLWTQYHLSRFLKRYPPALLFSPAYVAPRFLPKNIATINVVHGLEGEHFPEFNPLKNTVADYLTNVPALKKSSAIIAVSKHSKNDLHHFYGLPLNQIKVVLSGRGSLDDDFTAQPKKDRGTVKLLFLGGSNERKNLPLALRIFTQLQKLALSKITLHIAGEVTDDKMLKLIKANKNISLLGYVGEKRKIKLLESSHFLLYPSFYEGFGFPALEAQTCGAIPITLKGSGLNEVGGAGIVEFDPFQEKGSLAKIAGLIIDPKKYGQMQKKGVKNSQRFTWHACAQATKKILLKYI